MQDDRRERQEPPYRTNLAIAAALLIVTGFQLALVPALLLPDALPALTLLLLAALVTPLHSLLLHEAIHGRLLATPTSNRLVGRALSVTFGISFEVVRLGHLLHHGYNRHALDRPDVLEHGQNPLKAWLAYYAHLFGGVYVGEIAASLVFLLPRAAVRPLVESNFPAPSQPPPLSARPF